MPPRSKRSRMPLRRCTSTLLELVQQIRRPPLAVAILRSQSVP
jgi:hypothetical protein